MSTVEVAVTEEALVREMGWTSYGESCRDQAIVPDGDLRECRRRYLHAGDCASGFGPQLRRWQR